MTPRTCLWACLACLPVLGALALWGCGFGGTEAPGPKPGLRIATPMAVRQANPLADYGYNILAMVATHDTLVRFDATMAPRPQLARSWQVSADGRVWTFVLRHDARWHDGRPVTAGDVKFTFDYLGARHAASAWIQDLVKEIRIDGDRVVFFLTKPYSRFLINGGFIVRILPRHIWKEVADPRKPGRRDITMGCGPFVLNGFEPRRGRVSFKRNPDYYGPPARVETLDFLLNRNFEALTLSLMQGDADLFYKYASGYPSAFHRPLRADAKIRTVETDAMGITAALGFNLGRPPVDNIAFRRAVALAIDYDRINQSLAQGRGRRPSGGFVPPALACHVPLPALACDPAESRAWLEKAGMAGPDGKAPVLTLLARADLEGTDALVRLLSHDLARVGIRLAVERVDLPVWIARIRQDRYDLALFRTTPWGMVMDAGCASGYFDSRRKGGGTLANVSDPEFHALCDAVLATTATETGQALFTRIQRYYAENLPALALCWGTNLYPIRKPWQGAVANPIEGGLVNRQSLVRLHRAEEGN